MPLAATAATARRWATERAIDLWALFASDLPGDAWPDLASQLGAIRSDGARIALLTPPGVTPTDAERAVADLDVPAPASPSPLGLFRALEASGLEDVRRLGVLGSTIEALEAAHRAGAGAIVGVAPRDSAARRALLNGQPDRIVEASELGLVDRERYGRNRALRERVLLNPGPSVVSDRIHRAIAGPDLCHRESEYVALVRAVRGKLLRVADLGDDWSMALLAGSGTAALEAMTAASARPGRSLLVCRNGVYGERIEIIARRQGKDVVLVDAPATQPIEPDAVAKALDDDPSIDAIAVVHHETTSGLINPVQRIAEIARSRGVLTLVDGISSFGAEDLTLEGSGIDFLACTSNKCLHGLPGAAFVLVSPRGRRRAEEVPPTSLYFDLPNYLRAQDKGSVPFTPAIPAVYALDAALDELLDEGLVERQRAYQARVDFLDRELGRLGLEQLVSPPHRSRSVRSLRLPPGVAYEPLHDALKAEGYVIYAGLGDAAKTTFRVCALGNLRIGALQGFVEALERTLDAHNSGGQQIQEAASAR